MDKLKKYYTGYLISKNYEEQVQSYKGKGWSISFEKATYKDKAKQLVIYAASFTSAQNVLELINCSITLISGEVNSLGEQELVVPEDKTEYDKVCQKNLDQFVDSYSFVEVDFPRFSRHK